MRESDAAHSAICVHFLAFCGVFRAPKIQLNMIRCLRLTINEAWGVTTAHKYSRNINGVAEQMGACPNTFSRLFCYIASELKDPGLERLPATAKRRASLERGCRNLRRAMALLTGRGREFAWASLARREPSRRLSRPCLPAAESLGAPVQAHKRISRQRVTRYAV